MSQEFQREDRYIVIKRSDLQQAGHHALIAFHSANHNLRESMSKNGVPDRQFVVIESDWPEYEPVWAMIEARMSGAPVPPAGRQVEVVRYYLDATDGRRPELKESPDGAYCDYGNLTLLQDELEQERRRVINMGDIVQSLQSELTKALALLSICNSGFKDFISDPVIRDIDSFLAHQSAPAAKCDHARKHHEHGGTQLRCSDCGEACGPSAKEGE